MYEYLPFVFAAIFLFLGLLMAFKPQQSIKKEDRDSKEAIKKARKNGIILTIIAIIFVIICVVFI